MKIIEVSEIKNVGTIYTDEEHEHWKKDEKTGELRKLTKEELSAIISERIASW